MGDALPLSPSLDEDGSAASVPATVLARWAALASARACLGTIPQQVRA